MKVLLVLVLVACGPVVFTPVEDAGCTCPSGLRCEVDKLGPDAMITLCVLRNLP